jgi:hypothetical protein
MGIIIKNVSTIKKIKSGIAKLSAILKNLIFTSNQKFAITYNFDHIAHNPITDELFAANQTSTNAPYFRTPPMIVHF